MATLSNSDAPATNRQRASTPLELAREFAADDNWFIAHYAELLEQYPEMWVVVRDRHVVAAASDFQQLLASLPSDCDPGHTVIGRVTRDESVEII